MKKGEKTGFTMVEVALVLGIAGLIFLMMFIALPGLRAIQRDSRREEDMLDFIKDVKKFQSNNRGALPSGEGVTATVSGTDNNGWQKFYRELLGNDFVDPLGENYQLAITECGGSIVGGECMNNKARTNLEALRSSNFPNNYTIYIITQASCSDNEEQNVAASSNQRKIAVLYRLERGGIYCANS